MRGTRYVQFFDDRRDPIQKFGAIANGGNYKARSSRWAGVRSTWNEIVFTALTYLRPPVR